MPAPAGQKAVAQDERGEFLAKNNNNNNESYGLSLSSTGGVPFRSWGAFGLRQGMNGSYLVDPASSHMLVSKIKPCMSLYKL